MSTAEDETKPSADEPTNDGGGEEEEEEDLEKLQAEIARMEEEAARIAQETEDLEKSKDGGADAAKSDESKPATAADGAKKDGHSVYVGQVDYSSTPEELLAHFESCGTVERVTIVCDKFTGKPKGFAYLEFQNESAVENAVKLDGSTFKERQLKVTPKRVNDPHFYGGRGRGRGGGRGFRGRGRGFGRGGYGRGGGRGYRGRGRGYAPY